MNSLAARFKKNKFLMYGLPFLTLVFGGTFGLKEFSEIKFKYYRDRQKISPEEMSELGIKMKPSTEITLESEYEKLKDLDIDNWQQVRGPRPWEENENLATSK